MDPSYIEYSLKKEIDDGAVYSHVEVSFPAEDSGDPRVAFIALRVPTNRDTGRNPQQARFNITTSAQKRNVLPHTGFTR